MPPTLVLIRHAQAIHNMYTAQLREHLKSRLPADRKVQRIVVSPMRRAIQTCPIALDWLIDSGVPVVPDARWQEIYTKPCDTGTPAPQLAAEFPQIDFSYLDPVYPDKTSPAGARYAYEKGAILARGKAVLRDLCNYERNEEEDGLVVVVVSHSGFLRSAVAGRWFGNADYRGPYEEVPSEGGKERVTLVEWDSTKGKGGMGRSKEDLVEFGEGLPEDGGLKLG
ncbi:phosphoglycerate mutase-like protein [Parathielavia hyrcaniae]|uniref:Phosphoglycerate mutase-like protein n=1 Tax=Parathielavia hyrcaniae TaxID=113614 RepID=A0AAN6PR84_9PEZI|nr:phosphoglycerate mutase-like protein [Parathielavia hyrcaniae]